MRRYILGILCLLLGSPVLLKAQQNKSFEEYKEIEKAKFEKYKETEEQKFEDFKQEELDWNKAILGYSIENPVFAKEKFNAKTNPAKLPTPIYVDFKSNLSYEIGKLKKRSVTQSNTVQTKELLADTINKSILEIIPHSKPIHDSYRLSSKFAYRFHPTLFRWSVHGGIDMACPTGTPVYVPINGLVVQSGWVNGYGNYIKIKHPNGFETVYAHLSKINVKNGQKVEKNTVIGEVGSTGRSTGPHLHYEVLKNHKRVNPENFFL
jgi:murein DD-endopeptidase MepM/ murein hydrolase activator NlpD